MATTQGLPVSCWERKDCIMGKIEEAYETHIPSLQLCANYVLVLGYSILVMEWVGDEFISVRKNLIS